LLDVKFTNQALLLSQWNIALPERFVRLALAVWMAPRISGSASMFVRGR
jgi:hypothetical protein